MVATSLVGGKFGLGAAQFGNNTYYYFVLLERHYIHFYVMGTSVSNLPKTYCVVKIGGLLDGDVRRCVIEELEAKNLTIDVVDGNRSDHCPLGHHMSVVLLNMLISLLTPGSIGQDEV